MGKENKPNIEVRSCVLRHEVNCDKCHNYYWLVNVRIYAKDGRRYCRRRFVVWFDIFEVQDFYEGNKGITKKQLREYALMNADSFIETFGPKTFVNGLPKAEELKEFTSQCNKTIDSYNGIENPTSAW